MLDVLAHGEPFVPLLLYAWIVFGYSVSSWRSRDWQLLAQAFSYTIQTSIFYMLVLRRLPGLDGFSLFMGLFYAVLPFLLIVILAMGFEQRARYRHPLDILLLQAPLMKEHVPGLRQRHPRAWLVMLSSSLVILLGIVGFGLQSCAWLDRLAQRSGCVRAISIEGQVEDVAFVANGAWLVVGATNEGVPIWRTSDWTKLRTLRLPETGTSTAASPDGTLIATATYDDIVRVTRAADDTLVRIIDNVPAHSLAISPDGHMLATGESNVVRVWRIEDGRLMHTFTIPGDVYGLKFSPDNERLAAAGYLAELRIWRVADGALLHEIPTNTVYDLAWSPDGQSIAAAMAIDRVAVWRSSDGVQRWITPSRTNEPVYAVAWTSDGSQIVTGSHDKTLRLWNSANGGLLRSIPLSDKVGSLAIAPDNLTVAVATWDRRVQIWRINR